MKTEKDFIKHGEILLDVCTTSLNGYNTHEHNDVTISIIAVCHDATISIIVVFRDVTISNIVVCHNATISIIVVFHDVTLSNIVMFHDVTISLVYGFSIIWIQ